MELPRGITGFRFVDDPPLPDCDFAAFRGHCHAVARALNGRAIRIETPVRGVESNFARAVLELPTGRVAVLLNSHFPIIAFAEPPAAGEVTVRFIDAPGLAEVFRSFGVYELISVCELALPLTPAHCLSLAPVEQEQIDYWRPRSVGEMMFNFWD